MEKLTRVLEVKNRLGLHLRAAAKIVGLTNQYQSTVFLSFDGIRVNAKSIMNIAMLAAGIGSQLSAEIEGPDAQNAMDALARLFDEKFGED